MSTKKTVRFADAFQELESITAWFESEQADVDEGLKKFERGLELAKACKERLSQAQNKVEELKEKYRMEESP